INKTYEFQVQIADDKNTVTIARTLTQGIPILSIGNNGRVGVNCLPTDSATTSNTSTRLQVDGAVKAYSFNGMRGIATSLATNSDEYAASSKLTNSLNNSLTNMGKTLFPVGSIFFTTVNKNPGTFIGGTWVAWGSGRVPVGINTSDSDFNTTEKTGGAKTVNLSHSHTVNSHAHTTGGHTLTINEIPAHSHRIGLRTTDLEASGYGLTGSVAFANRVIVSTTSLDVITNNSGGGASHSHGNTGNASPGTNSQLSNSQSILQPYITCYMWKRTA
ncbi:MAG: phage baseplate protein, partial [Monoglobus pectinilyticus]